MFRLLKLLIVLGVGAFLGFKFNGMLMKSECTAGNGQWTGNMCLSAEQ